jgi:outer membrane protein TolC
LCNFVCLINIVFFCGGYDSFAAKTSHDALGEHAKHEAVIMMAAKIAFVRVSGCLAGFRKAGLGVALVLTAGCLAPDAGDDPVAPAVRGTAGYVLGGDYQGDWRPALTPEKPMAQIATQANALAIARSPNVFNLRAAEAESAAEQASWLPNVRPVASAGLDGATPVVGVSVTQLIYDFTQTRSRREQAEIRRVMTDLDFWAERNDKVRDALLAYIDAIEASEVLAIRAALDAQLQVLAVREEDRRQSGVASISDALFVDVSRQENRREEIRQRARLTNAQAQFQREAGMALPPMADLRIDRVLGSCARSDVTDYSPELLRAQMAVELAEKARTAAERGLLPRITGQTQLTNATDGDLAGASSIALEGGALIGGGARLRVDAERQRALAAERTLANLRQDLTRDLDRLAIELIALEGRLDEYRDLIATTEQTLALFADRFAIGAAASSEAARLEVNRAEHIIAEAETRAEIQRNCVLAARLTGALAAAAVTDETAP